MWMLFRDVWEVTEERVGSAGGVRGEQCNRFPGGHGEAEKKRREL